MEHTVGDAKTFFIPPYKILMVSIKKERKSI